MYEKALGSGAERDCASVAVRLQGRRLLRRFVMMASMKRCSRSVVPTRRFPRRRGRRRWTTRRCRRRRRGFDGLRGAAPADALALTADWVGLGADAGDDVPPLLHGVQGRPRRGRRGGRYDSGATRSWRAAPPRWPWSGLLRRRRRRAEAPRASFASDAPDSAAEPRRRSARARRRYWAPHPTGWRSDAGVSRAAQCAAQAHEPRLPTAKTMPTPIRGRPSATGGTAW